MKAKKFDDELFTLQADYDAAVMAAREVGDKISRMIRGARFDRELQADPDYNARLIGVVGKLNSAVEIGDAMLATAAKYVRNPK